MPSHMRAWMRANSSSAAGGAASQEGMRAAQDLKAKYEKAQADMKLAKVYLDEFPVLTKNAALWKKSSEFMRTSSDFAANPIGTFFDPARVYDALKSGIEFKTLQASIRAGQYVPATIPNIGLPL